MSAAIPNIGCHSSVPIACCRTLRQAELLYHWVAAAAARSAPDAFPDFLSGNTGWLTNRTALLGDGPKSSESVVGDALCFSLDETFGGSVQEPTIVRASGWRRTTHEYGVSGERKLKPGYSATASGSALVIDTTAAGTWFRVGYLRTDQSRAVARVSCLPPCACEPLDLQVGAAKKVAINEYSWPHPFQAPSASCHLELRLSSQGQRFKFVGLQVGS